MRRGVWLGALALLVVACGAPGVAAGVTLDEWCPVGTPEDCFQGATAIAWGLDPSCLEYGSTFQAVIAGCADDRPPVTTIPFPTSSTEVDLTAIEKFAEDALIRAHPDGRFIVALKPAFPFSLPEAMAMAGSLGGELVAAWRTDEVCVTAWAASRGTEPSRFARVDGVERASNERVAAEAASTPITGRHIVEAAWARMADEATALGEPGVMLAAVAVDVRIGDIPTIRADGRFSAVALVDPNSFELSIVLEPAAPVDCS